MVIHINALKVLPCCWNDCFQGIDVDNIPKKR